MENQDPRYLAGILLFNEQDFFEAHEVWEDLWSESHGTQRRFYQGLLQAAVGLCHYSNGNLGGALKLYHSSRAYLEACGPVFQGLNLTEFWKQMDICYAPLLNTANLDRSLRLDPERVPTLTLDPPPDQWPDPEEYLTERD